MKESDASQEKNKNDETLLESGTQTDVSDGIVPSKITNEDDLIHDTRSNSMTEDQQSSSDSEPGKTKVDAVHPLFTNYRNRLRKRTISTSTSDDKKDLCYCEQCEVYFLRSIPNTVQHFVNIQHKPDNNCVYCNGPVYYYIINDKRNLYHKCRKDQVESCSLKGKSENNNNITKS